MTTNALDMIMMKSLIPPVLAQTYPKRGRSLSLCELLQPSPLSISNHFVILLITMC